MRSSNPALRATAVVAVVAALSAGMATTAQAGKTSKGRPGGTVVTTTTTTTTTTALSASSIKSVHDSVCPSVAEYTSCAGLSITVSDAGATGWTATSAPGNRTTSYNRPTTRCRPQLGPDGLARDRRTPRRVERAGRQGRHHPGVDRLLRPRLLRQDRAEGRYKAVVGTVRTFTLQ